MRLYDLINIDWFNEILTVSLSESVHLDLHNLIFETNSVHQLPSWIRKVTLGLEFLVERVLLYFWTGSNDWRKSVDQETPAAPKPRRLGLPLFTTFCFPCEQSIHSITYTHSSPNTVKLFNYMRTVQDLVIREISSNPPTSACCSSASINNPTGHVITGGWNIVSNPNSVIFFHVDPKVPWKHIIQLEKKLRFN